MFRSYLEAPVLEVQIRACTNTHGIITCIFSLNNCALFLLNCLLLSSSLCFSFPPQYYVHLQIIVPLSTQNLLWTENFNALSILFNMMNILRYFSFLFSWGFFTGWNNFYFSSLYSCNFFQIQTSWYEDGPICPTVFLYFSKHLGWSNKQKCIPCYKSFSYP